MVAKRNAELRRKAREASSPPEPELSHTLASTGAIRAREVTLAVSQSVGGVLLIIAGVGLMLPIGFMLPLLLGGPVFFILLLFLWIVVIGLALFGGVLIRMGIAMLKSAYFQSRGAPMLRTVGRLAYDAVPVTAYVVDSGSKVIHALITFESHPDELVFMPTLAARLAASELLEDLLCDGEYVEDRRLRIPRELAAGRLVYLVDLELKRKRRSIRPVLHCVAEPGSSGRIVSVE
jgi:hypothetical protein